MRILKIDPAKCLGRECPRVNHQVLDTIELDGFIKLPKNSWACSAENVKMFNSLRDTCPVKAIEITEVAE